jgi:hypothetical protein
MSRELGAPNSPWMDRLIAGLRARLWLGIDDKTARRMIRRRVNSKRKRLRELFP